MKFSQAKKLGVAAGVETVDDFVQARMLDCGIEDEYSEVDAHEALLATLQPGHDAWSEGAAGARAHAVDGVPDEDPLRMAYYRAYDQGARKRIAELTA